MNKDQKNIVLSEDAGSLSGLPKHIIKHLTTDQQGAGENSSIEKHHADNPVALNNHIKHGLDSGKAVAIHVNGKLHKLISHSHTGKFLVHDKDTKVLTDKENKSNYGTHKSDTFTKRDAVSHAKSDIDDKNFLKSNHVEVHHISKDKNRSDKSRDRMLNHPDVQVTSPRAGFRGRTRTHTAGDNLASVKHAAALKLAKKHLGDKGTPDKIKDYANSLDGLKGNFSSSTKKHLSKLRESKHTYKEETTMNPIAALIESIQEGDAVSVSMLFDKLMAQKLSEAIEDKKVEIAESIFVPDEDRELQEDYEQLDELSKQTLGNYLMRNHQSSGELQKKKTDNEHAQQKAMDIDYGSDREAASHVAPVRDALRKSGAKIGQKLSRRSMGMYRAVRNLTKEDVEEFLQSEEFQALDELSKTTLGKYVKKAALDRVKRTKREYELDTKNDQLSNAMHNIDDREARDAIHVARSKVWQQRQDNDDKHEKRRDGINKAIKRLTSEDLEMMTDEEIDSLIENADQLDEVSGKLLGSYIQKARADRQKKYDHENELSQHPKVKAIVDKRRDYYNRREYDKYGNSKYQKQIDALHTKETETKKKLDPAWPKSGLRGANKRGRGIEAATKKLTQGKLTD